MLKTAGVLIHKLLDFLLPPRTNFEIVKKLSEKDIHELPKPLPFRDEEWIHPLFSYKDKKVKAIIWELKYKDNTKPLETIGKILFDEILAIASDISTFDSDAIFVIIPIPITSEKRQNRGYNQSEYIAKSIIQYDTGHILLYAPQWLAKTKDTPSQSHSESKEERIKNLVDSFTANSQVQNKYIILVDDVVTTGSTLKEARKEILSKGPIEVISFTIAH
ncbi:MAG: phosphoribosyltransferase family protein [Minisyncoccia bacterium]